MLEKLIAGKAFNGTYSGRLKKLAQEKQISRNLNDEQALIGGNEALEKGFDFAPRVSGVHKIVGHLILAKRRNGNDPIVGKHDSIPIGEDRSRGKENGNVRSRVGEFFYFVQHRRK